MKVIQELIAYFERRGRLTGPQIRKLLDQGLLAGDAPPNMLTLCDPIGATYYFRVTGETTGSLWGTDVYTGDYRNGVRLDKLFGAEQIIH